MSPVFRVSMLALLLLLALPSPAAAGPTTDGGEAVPNPASQRGRAYAHMMRSMFAARRGEFRAAAGEIRRAIELQPDSIEVRLQGALMMNAMGRRAEAEQIAEQALEIDPESNEALKFLADLAAEQALSSQRTPESRVEALRLYEELERRDALDAEALLRLANLRMLNNDTDGAIATARKLIELKPGDRHSTQMLYRLLVHSGRQPEALDALLAFVAGHPDERAMLGEVEKLARAIDGWVAVAEILSASEVMAGRATLAHGLLGEALLRTGRINDATGILERALQADSTDHAVRHRLVMAYRQVGRLADAAVLARALADDLPDRPDVQIILAETLDQQRDLAAALAGYDATLRLLSGEDHAEGGPFRDEIRRRRALLHLQMDEPGAAAEILDTVEDPEDWETIELRARTAITAKDWTAARQAVKRLRGRDHPGAVALLEGEILARTGRLAKAQARFQEALDVLPPRARASIADTYFRVERPELGEAVLREWVERSPDSADAHFELGRFLHRLDRFGDAESALRASLRLDPDNPTALNFLGYGFAERNIRLEEALDLVQRALAIDYWEGAYLDSLGWVYFRMGMFDEAREPLERAAREYPKDPIILEHLGDVYQRLDEPALALSAWTRALSGGPEDAGGLRDKIAWQRGELEATEAQAREPASRTEPPM